MAAKKIASPSDEGKRNARCKKLEPTQERLKELLDYDLETGVFRWRVRRGCKQSGEVAGAPNAQGYIQIQVDGRNCLAHRIAFIYVTRSAPEVVDHINMKRSDNRFENIRAASCSNNNMNRSIQTNNTSGVSGVSFVRQRNKWFAYIRFGGGRKSLGMHSSFESAVQARREAEKIYFGEFARTA